MGLNRPDPTGTCCQCRPVACDSCCPTASVVCDSITATKNKCGHNQYFGFVSSPPVIYLVRDKTFREVFTPSCGITDPTHTCVAGTDATGTLNETYDPSSCAHPEIIDGSVITTRCDGSTTTGTFPYAGGGLSMTPTDDRHRAAHTSEVLTGSAGCTDENHDTDTSEVLSMPFTTASLISLTKAALPSYSGTYGCGGSHTTGQGCLCSALYALSTSEISFIIRRFRYKLTLSGAACAGLVVTWNEHFVASPSGIVTDTPKTWTAAIGGETETDEYTCPDPTENGTTTITDVVVDCSECP